MFHDTYHHGILSQESRTKVDPALKREKGNLIGKSTTLAVTSKPSKGRPLSAITQKCLHPEENELILYQYGRWGLRVFQAYAIGIGATYSNKIDEEDKQHFKLQDCLYKVVFHLTNIQPQAAREDYNDDLRMLPISSTANMSAPSLGSQTETYSLSITLRP